METLDWSSSSGVSDLPSVPALTIVYHTDLRRVGERAVLSGLQVGRDVAIARDTPIFGPPSRAPAAPLVDACVSRTPLHLQALPGGGVRIRRGEGRMKLEYRGAAVTGDLELPAADVDRGAVLRLGGLVVLLLHRIVPGVVPDGDSLGLVGDSHGMEQVRREIARVAELEVPVLLRGETGTGKELVARAVHLRSARRGGPFVAVNLGAIAPELAAAELFGAERGAFTGAVRQQEGYFSAAHGGTLFLDEIGEASVALQAMLLRAIEYGEIQRVGAARPQKADVRIVAATDADLESKIQDGSFRAPLFHRLSACEIWIPPLRERRDDIGRLLLHFLRAELTRSGEIRRLAPAEKPWLPASLVARLADLDWPGNVRQLQNTARQLALSGRGRDQIEITASIERVLAAPPARSVPPPPRPAPEPSGAPEPPFRRRPADVTEAELVAALRANRWELAPTAEALRISRASLYVLVERSARLRKAGDLTPEEISRCYQECGRDVAAMVDRLEVSEKALRRRLRELGLIES
jgi:DNA-binding NtrC family response regulator